MPRYNIGQTAADFEFRWRHWQTEVVARIDEGEFATCQQLAIFAKVLAGDDTTFKEEVQPKCETWYEWLIGKMLFTNPSVKIYDLPFHAEEAITNFGGLGSMTSLDSILLAGELKAIFDKTDVKKAVIFYLLSFQNQKDQYGYYGKNRLFSDHSVPLVHTM